MSNIRPFNLFPARPSRLGKGFAVRENNRFNQSVANSPFRGAVLDLGSNTFKLLLAEQTGSTLRVHHEKAYPARLGEGVALTRRLQPASCRRALALLAQLEKEIRLFQPHKTIAVATGTLRQAKNSASFLIPASRILKKKVLLLSGKEEGRLIARAARTLSRTASPRFHIDLGGGSLEVIDSLRPTRPKIFSLNLGCVAVRDTLLPHYPPSPAQWQEALTLIRLALKKIPVPTGHPQATFSGGTGHAYACLLQGKNIKARKLEGFSLTLPKLTSLLLRVLPLSHHELLALPGMPSDRATLALPAFLVLHELMHRLKLTAVHLTTHGLRYGVWLDRFPPRRISKILR